MTRAIADLFSRKGLLNGFGPHPASVGTSLEIVHKSGTGSIDMNIGEFVETFMPEGSVQTTVAGEPLYIFQRGVLGTDIVTPSVTGVFDPEATEVNIWMVGPPLSGTTFHFHASAFTGLAVGRKRWLLYPPTMTPPGGGSGPNAVPTFPITYWFSDVYPKLDERTMRLQLFRSFLARNSEFSIGISYCFEVRIHWKRIVCIDVHMVCGFYIQMFHVCCTAQV